MIVPGMFVCSSFLISVCMFIVSKALLISSATVIVREGGAIWLNPFATVLFSVCSAVTVECCVLYPCCMGVVGCFGWPPSSCVCAIFVAQGSVQGETQALRMGCVLQVCIIPFDF